MNRSQLPMNIRRRLRRLAGTAYRRLQTIVSRETMHRRTPMSRDLIQLAYQAILGRHVDPDTLASQLNSLESGRPFADIFVEIATSEEAQRRTRALGRPTEKPITPISTEDLAKLAYEVLLGREAEHDILARSVSLLESDSQFVSFFVDIARSEEAVRHANVIAGIRTAQDDDASTQINIEHDAVSILPPIVVAGYKQFLRRSPSEQETKDWVDQLKCGLSLERFFRAIIESEEARSLPIDLIVGAALSDGEFLVTGGALLYGRGLIPQEVASWQRVLDEQPDGRQQFVLNMLNEHLNKVLGGEKDEPYDPSKCQIMGSTRILTKRLWEERSWELLMASQDQLTQPHMLVPERKSFEHSGIFKVSMIASLYKGGKFIRRFLENITSQSSFEVSELIIIDACSPENEFQVIEEFQKRFDNIVYRRVDFRIGIYEAWNLGVELSRGEYLSNTNLDDLRRVDSIEVQLQVLDNNDDVDVVYQDFYYTFDSSLSFHEIAAFGFKSELPILTANNLLVFNSPHNAPMWRAKLHVEVGKFDTRYRSAGDYEFWLRCLTKGKTFRKINSPHVAYFQNPEGVSTRPDTMGIEEAHHILTRYSARLISPALLQSRDDFRSCVGVEAASDASPKDTTYYDLAQQALLELGRRRSARIRQCVEDSRSQEEGAIAP